MDTNNEKEIIITIKDGQMEIDQVGYVESECVSDAVAKRLRKIGRMTSHKMKIGGDTRPVHDANVIDVGL